MSTKINFKMYQGSTFSEPIRWESATKIYKPITSVLQSAPLVINCADHGMPAGWRFKISNVGGMKEVNSTDIYQLASTVTTSSITINAINAVGFSAYTTGGIIEYSQPVSLAGVTARMQLRDKIGSTTVIDEYSTENGKITINDSTKTITILVDAVTTAAYTFNSAVYGLEMVSGSIVSQIASGTITLIKEVTR